MLTITYPVLNLSIMDLRDINSLAIVDLSSYETIPNANQLALQITAPGAERVNVPFTPGSVNIYKCEDLGIICGVAECCPLPDGIYDVVYSIVNPNNTTPAQNAVIEKTFIRVDNIRCSYQNAFCKIDMDCNCLTSEQKRYKQELQRVDLFINGAVAAANDCDNARAYRLYNKAEMILNGLCCTFGLATTTCNKCSPCVIAGNCATCNN